MLIGVHLAAALLVLLLLYGLQELVREAPDPQQRFLMRSAEAFLGLLNGMLVGVSAGVGMFITARSQDTPHSPLLMAAIRKHAWTFAGAGRFSIRSGSVTAH